MAALIKRALETALVRIGVPPLGRALMRHRALVLAYHNVVPAGVANPGDGSLHLPVASFMAQLEALLSTHEVVPLTELAQPHARPRGRPRAAITFDDAYRGAVTIAVEELARRGVPATVFVCPAFVGGAPFWWDVLAAARGGGLDPVVRELAISELRGCAPAVQEWATARGLAQAAVPEMATAASEPELRQAVRHPGISLGSHSWSHANLSRLAAAELSAELVRPLEWLRARFDRVIPWLSYPYGLSSPAVERAAAEAGYAAALRIDGGWVGETPTAWYTLPRLNIPVGLSLNGFVLQGAGIRVR